MAVIHSARAPVMAGSIQSIVIVLFLVGVLYLFLSGGRGKRTSTNSTNSGGGAGSGFGSGDVESIGDYGRSEKGENGGDDGRRSKSDRGGQKKDSSRSRSKSKSKSKRKAKTDGQTTDSEPSSAESSNNRKRKSKRKTKDKDKDKERAQKRAEREQKKKDKKERDKKAKPKPKPKSTTADPDFSAIDEKWAPPPEGSSLTSPRAPPDHRTASPTRGVFRQRSPDDKLPPSPNTLKGNRIKWTDLEGQSDDVVTKHFKAWGEYTGLEDHSDQAFKHRPGKSEGPPKGIREDPLRFSVDKFDQKDNRIPEELKQYMREAERIGKAKPADGRMWAEALQDVWDPQLGPVPRIAQAMAQRIASHITKQDLRVFQQAMKGRKKAQANHDKKRDFNKFQKSLGIPPEHPEFIYKLVLGWYLDWLRCKNYLRRMQIHDEPITMITHEKIGPMSQMLGWMEYFGQLTKEQRLFVGLDLSGLAVRAQAMKENGGYRLDLTIFMPGGPMAKAQDGDFDWYKRLNESCEAFRMFHVEIARTFDNTTDDGSFKDPFTRRRLIFRPGWTVQGVDIDKLDDPKPEKSVAQKQLLARRPRAFDLPENMSQLQSKYRADAPRTKIVRKVITGLAPGEVCFQHIRQFAWDNVSLTKENSTFTPSTFWLAWKMCGEDLHGKQTEIEKKQYEKLEKVRSLDFIRSLDLGGNVPIHLTNPPQFLRIGGFPALELLVLAYIPLGQKGGTVEFMLKPEFGLRKELERHREQSRHLYRPPPKLKLFISSPDMRGLETIRRDLDWFFNDQARRWVESGQYSKALTRSNLTGLAMNILENVFFVDESNAGTVGEGRPTHSQGIRIDYTPKFDKWLLDEQGGGGGGGGGGGPPQDPFSGIRPSQPPSGPPGGSAGPAPPAMSELPGDTGQGGSGRHRPPPLNLSPVLPPGAQPIPGMQQRSAGGPPVSPRPGPGSGRSPARRTPPAASAQALAAAQRSADWEARRMGTSTSAAWEAQRAAEFVEVPGNADERQPFSGNPLARHAPNPRYQTQRRRQSGTQKPYKPTKAPNAEMAQRKANALASANAREAEQYAEEARRAAQRTAQPRTPQQQRPTSPRPQPMPQPQPQPQPQPPARSPAPAPAPAHAPAHSPLSPRPPPVPPRPPTPTSAGAGARTPQPVFPPRPPAPPAAMASPGAGVDDEEDVPMDPRYEHMGAGIDSAFRGGGGGR